MSGDNRLHPAAVLVVAAWSAALLAGTGVARQAPDPMMRILAPLEGEYVSGEVVIRAGLFD